MLKPTFLASPNLPERGENFDDFKLKSFVFKSYLSQIGDELNASAAWHHEQVLSIDSSHGSAIETKVIIDGQHQGALTHRGYISDLKNDTLGARNAITLIITNRGISGQS